MFKFLLRRVMDQASGDPILYYCLLPPCDEANQNQLDLCCHICKALMTRLDIVSFILVIPVPGIMLITNTGLLNELSNCIGSSNWVSWKLYLFLTKLQLSLSGKLIISLMACKELTAHKSKKTVARNFCVCEFRR